MHRLCKLLAAVMAFAFCLVFAACAPDVSEPKGEQATTATTSVLTTPEETTPEETTPEETTPEETTPEETTPEETTPEETAPAVTEPDFSNTPDPDGTKRY